MSEKAINSTLVSSEWLATHINDPDLVVLDGSYFMPALGRDANLEYLSRRIPGALRFDIDAIKAPDVDLPHMLPSADLFARAVGAMGISNTTLVVVYDALGIMSAPRVWWTFRVFGHDKVAVLDGGLPKWIEEGRPLQSTPLPTPKPAKFTAQFRSDLVASCSDVLSISNALLGSVTDTQIVDARSSSRWQGKEPEPRPGLASGHIPGSRNVPFGSLLRQDGTFDTPTEISTTFAARGIHLDQPIVASCGSGITACVVAFAAMLAGAQRVSVYDGSWAEWGRDPNLPIATGSA